MTCGVYAIRCLVDGRTYVGQSKNVKTRLRNHRRLLETDEHWSYRLQAAWNIHGPEQFAFFILEEVAHRKDLDERETWWITTLRSLEPHMGYNKQVP